MAPSRRDHSWAATSTHIVYQKDKGGEAAKAAIAMFEIGQKFSG